MSFKHSLVSNAKVNVAVLKKLRDIFNTANVDKDPGLDLEEFINAFAHVLGLENERQTLVNLYMKIDANSDGKVDWSEFLEFMLLEKAGLDLIESYEFKTDIKKICK